MKSLSLVAASALLGLSLVACAADGSEPSSASGDLVGAMGSRSMSCTPADACLHSAETGVCVNEIHLTNTTFSYQHFPAIGGVLEPTEEKLVVKSFSQSAADDSATWTSDNAKVSVKYDAAQKAYVGTMTIAAHDYAVTCDDVTDAH